MKIGTKVVLGILIKIGYGGIFKNLLSQNGGHFTKWLPASTKIPNISSTSHARMMILVSIPMFSGSMNLLKSIISSLGV